MATNSPVNWQVKHRTWQAIGSHLAAAGRMAPQIPYPDAKLQRFVEKNRRNEKRESRGKYIGYSRGMNVKCKRQHPAIIDI